MIVTLIGAVRKSGEYQGRQYDKLQLYFSKPLTDESVSAGIEVIDPKFTYFSIKNLPSMCADVTQPSDFFQLIGFKFDISFNQYRNLDTLRLIKEDLQ